jgi:hypothetical protein
VQIFAILERVEAGGGGTLAVWARIDWYTKEWNELGGSSQEIGARDVFFGIDVEQYG